MDSDDSSCEHERGFDSSSDCSFRTARETSWCSLEVNDGLSSQRSSALRLDSSSTSGSDTLSTSAGDSSQQLQALHAGGPDGVALAYEMMKMRIGDSPAPDTQSGSGSSQEMGQCGLFKVDKNRLLDEQRKRGGRDLPNHPGYPQQNHNQQPMFQPPGGMPGVPPAGIYGLPQQQGIPPYMAQAGAAPVGPAGFAQPMPPMVPPGIGPYQQFGPYPPYQNPLQGQQILNQQYHQLQNQMLAMRAQLQQHQQRQRTRQGPGNREFDETNVYVAHLPVNMSHEEFFDMMSKFGTVVSSRVLVGDHWVKKGVRGVGFARMSTEEEAAQAIKEVNNMRLPGSNIMLRARMAFKTVRRDAVSDMDCNGCEYGAVNRNDFGFPMPADPGMMFDWSNPLIQQAYGIPQYPPAAPGFDFMAANVGGAPPLAPYYGYPAPNNYGMANNFGAGVQAMGLQHPQIPLAPVSGVGLSGQPYGFGGMQGPYGGYPAVPPQAAGTGGMANYWFDPNYAAAAAAAGMAPPFIPPQQPYQHQQQLHQQQQYQHNQQQQQHPQFDTTTSGSDEEDQNHYLYSEQANYDGAASADPHQHQAGPNSAGIDPSTSPGKIQGSQRNGYFQQNNPPFDASCLWTNGSPVPAGTVVKVTPSVYGTPKCGQGAIIPAPAAARPAAVRQTAAGGDRFVPPTSTGPTSSAGRSEGVPPGVYASWHPRDRGDNGLADNEQRDVRDGDKPDVAARGSRASLSSSGTRGFNSGTNLAADPSNELGSAQWSPSTTLRKSASGENLSPQQKDIPGETGDGKPDDRSNVGATEHPAG